MIRHALFPLVLAAGVTAAVGLAAADGHHRPPRPPPEAVAACDGKATGDACAVTIHDHTIDGTCRTAPDTDSGPLACAPDHPPGPPPEAIDACSGKAVGDACSIDHHGEHLDGTCRRGPDDTGPLACAPAR